MIYFETVAQAEARKSDRENEMIFILESASMYYYLSSGSGFTRDGVNVLNTGDGGGTRWVIIGDPIGKIAPWPVATAPPRWVICDGSQKSRTTTYGLLYAIIGTTWGVGDGASTFNIPDAVGAALVGAGTSSGYTQNETITLATKHDDRMQGHLHNINAYTSVNEASGYGLPVTAGFQDRPLVSTTGGQSTGGPVTDGSNGTPRFSSTTRNKSIGVHWIIKY